MRKIYLLASLLVFMVGCEKDEIIHNDPQQDVKTEVIRKRVTGEQINKNTKVVKRLKEISGSTDLNKEPLKSANLSKYGFHVFTDVANYFEKENYHSYTFEIWRPNGKAMENLVLSQWKGKDYKAFIVSYNLTEVEKTAFLNGEKVSLAKKATITSIDGFAPHDVLNINSKSMSCYEPYECTSRATGWNDICYEEVPCGGDTPESLDDSPGGGGSTDYEDPSGGGDGYDGSNDEPTGGGGTNDDSGSDFTNGSGPDEPDSIENTLPISENDYEDPLTDYDFHEESAEVLAFEQDYRAGMSNSEKEIFDDLSRFKQLDYLHSGFLAKTYAEIYYDETTLYNGIGDAYRHALWNALAINKLGYTLTEQLTSAHENRSPDYLYEYKEVEMDLFNNNIGRNIGSQSSFNLITKVKNALENGELRYLSNTTPRATIFSELTPTNQ